MQKQIKKYSYTLFNVSQQYNIADKLVEQLSVIKNLYKQEADLRLLLKSKRIDEKIKHTIIKNVFVQFESVVVEFLCILITQKQTANIINIINKFLSLAKKELDANKIEVITAESINAEILNKLFGELKYQIKYTVDPTIIGGMKIKHENTIIDNSVSCQLGQLKKTLHNM